jgi:hypothetical protein
MQKGADKAMAAVAVIITAARPVRVIREKLKHQIEQLHRFTDFRFGHWLDSSRSWGDAPSASPAVTSCISLCHLAATGCRYGSSGSG